MMLGAVPALAEPMTEQKQQDIRRLIELTGMAAVTAQSTDALSRELVFVFREARQDVPDDLFLIIRKELDAFYAEHANDPNGLAERVVPIYAKHFSHAEIRELLKFYQSELGRKTAAVQPLLSRESVEAGLAWGQEMTPLFLSRVEKALRVR
jgi:hypothetical protein